MYTQEMLLKEEMHLCFDDIMLIPGYSELESRNSPNISVSFGHLKLELPIISSPMDTITGHKMLVTMDKMGGIGILTRFINAENELHLQIHEIKKAKSDKEQYAQTKEMKIGCAIGIRGNVKERSKKLIEEGCDIICFDVAHGDHKKMYEAIDSVNQLKDSYTFSLMAGNICTMEATKRYVNAGVDIAKIGIGPGAACTTRRVTGFGSPQLFAILQCSYVANKYSNMQIIADGGLRNTGDIVKSLWAGADCCMLGFMLAGTSDSPDIDGKKAYRGMSSRTVHGRKDIASEGIDINIAYRGLTEEKLLEYKAGIKSGLAMYGAEDIQKLRKSECVRVSPMTMKESEPLKEIR